KNKAHHHTGLRLPDLIKKAESLQVDGGLLFLLLPARRLSEIKSLLQLHHMQLESILHVHQTPSHAAFRILIRAIKTKTHNILCEEKTLIIKNAESSYTNEFVQLLKDYYLYL